MIKKLKAFTLAEVLITTAIIGAVSVLAIPTLINSIEEKITVAKVKKIYSALNDSYMKARMKYGPLAEWGASRSFSTYDASGNCVAVTVSDQRIYAVGKMLYGLEFKYDISNQYQYSNLNQTTASTSSRPFILKDNIEISTAWIGEPQCNGNVGSTRERCGDFYVDINGKKKPNMEGRDIFHFYITKNSIIPIGYKTDASRSIRTDNNFCDITTSKGYNGYACAAWVIEKGNMDYLHKRVFWDD